MVATVLLFFVLSFFGANYLLSRQCPALIQAFDPFTIMFFLFYFFVLGLAFLPLDLISFLPPD